MGMTDTNKRIDPTEEKIVVILERIFDTAFRQSHLLSDRKGSNTLTSDIVFAAKAEILQLIREAKIDELNLAHADERHESFNTWTILPEYFYDRINELKES